MARRRPQTETPCWANRGRPGGGPGRLMPCQPHPAGGWCKRRGLYNRLFCLVVVNVYNTSPFGCRRCAAPSPSQALGLCAGRGRAPGRGPVGGGQARASVAPPHARQGVGPGPRPGVLLQGLCTPPPLGSDTICSRAGGHAILPSTSSPCPGRAATTRTGSCSTSTWVIWCTQGPQPTGSESGPSTCFLQQQHLVRWLPALGRGCPIIPGRAPEPMALRGAARRVALSVSHAGGPPGPHPLWGTAVCCSSEVQKQPGSLCCTCDPAPAVV